MLWENENTKKVNFGGNNYDMKRSNKFSSNLADVTLAFSYLHASIKAGCMHITNILLWKLPSPNMIRSTKIKRNISGAISCDNTKYYPDKCIMPISLPDDYRFPHLLLILKLLFLESYNFSS